jgi:hypothetical protein
MKPIVTPEQFNNATPLCGEVIKLLEAKTDPHTAMAALAMALVFTADAANETPLESVFQAMRLMRRGFAAMQSDLDDKRQRGELPSKDSGIVTPEQGKIIIP